MNKRTTVPGRKARQNDRSIYLSNTHRINHKKANSHSRHVRGSLQLRDLSLGQSWAQGGQMTIVLSNFRVRGQKGQIMRDILLFVHN